VKITNSELVSETPRPRIAGTDKKRSVMKIVVIGAADSSDRSSARNSLIAAKMWWRHRPGRREFSNGEGLAGAVSGAQIVVDVANAPPGMTRP